MKRSEKDTAEGPAWGVAAVLKAARASLADPSRPFTPADVGRHPLGGAEPGRGLALPDPLPVDPESLRRRPTSLPALPPLPRASRGEGRLLPEPPALAERRQAGSLARSRSAHSHPAPPPPHPGQRASSAQSGRASPEPSEAPGPAADVWTAADGPTAADSGGAGDSSSAVDSLAQRVLSQAEAVQRESAAASTDPRGLGASLAGLLAVLSRSQGKGLLRAVLAARAGERGTVGGELCRVIKAAFAAEEQARSEAARVAACSCALLTAQTGKDPLLRTAAAALYELSRKPPASGAAADAFDAPLTARVLWAVREIVNLSTEAESGDQEMVLLLAGVVSNVAARSSSEGARYLQSREGAAQVISQLKDCACHPSAVSSQLATSTATALRNIFAVSRSAMAAAARWGATQALVSTLGAFVDAADVAFAVSRALAKVSLDSASCQILSERQNVAFLTAALREHFRNGVIVLRLAFILGNLTAERSFDKEYLAFDLGAAALLEDGLAQCVEACESELGAEGARGRGGSSGGGAVSVGSVEVATKLVRLVANIATNARVGQHLVGRRAMFASLAHLMKLYTLDSAEELVLNAAVAVGNLAYYGFAEPESGQHHAATTIVLRLAAVLCSGHTEAVAEAARALGNLSLHHEAREAICASSADEALCILVGHADPDVAHAATGAVINLASDPACVARLLKFGVLEQLAEVVETALQDRTQESDAGPSERDAWGLPVVAVKAMDNVVRVGGEILDGEVKSSLLAFICGLSEAARGEDGAQENGTEKNDRGLDKLSADVAPAGTRQSQQERQHLDHEKQQGGDRLLFAECVDALAERLRAAS